jgi:hypothetical protein
MGRTIGAHCRDLLCLGHVAFASLHEFEIARRRSRVAFAKFIAGDGTILPLNPAFHMDCFPAVLTNQEWPILGACALANRFVLCHAL